MSLLKTEAQFEPGMTISKYEYANDRWQTVTLFHALILEP